MCHILMPCCYISTLINVTYLLELYGRSFFSTSCFIYYSFRKIILYLKTNVRRDMDSWHLIFHLYFLAR